MRQEPSQLALEWVKSNKPYHSAIILNVEEEDQGYSIHVKDLGTTFINLIHITPKIGQICDVYGKGMGYPTQALVIDNNVIYAYTDDEMVANQKSYLEVLAKKEAENQAQRELNKQTLCVIKAREQANLDKINGAQYDAIKRLDCLKNGANWLDINNEEIKDWKKIVGEYYLIMITSIYDYEGDPILVKWDGNNFVGEGMHEEHEIKSIKIWC